ncbi:hypothetical protein RUND412_009050 [Rhizina undulata]
MTFSPHTPSKVSQDHRNYLAKVKPLLKDEPCLSLIERLFEWNYLLQSSVDAVKAAVPIRERIVASEHTKPAPYPAASQVPATTSTGGWYEYHYFVPTCSSAGETTEYTANAFPLNASALMKMTLDIEKLFALNQDQVIAIQALVSQRNSKTAVIGQWEVAGLNLTKDSGPFGVVIKFSHDIPAVLRGVQRKARPRQTGGKSDEIRKPSRTFTNDNSAETSPTSDNYYSAADSLQSESTSTETCNLSASADISYNTPTKTNINQEEPSVKSKISVAVADLSGFRSSTPSPPSTLESPLSSTDWHSRYCVVPFSLTRSSNNEVPNDLTKLIDAKPESFSPSTLTKDSSARTSMSEGASVDIDVHTQKAFDIVSSSGSPDFNTSGKGIGEASNTRKADEMTANNVQDVSAKFSNAICGSQPYKHDRSQCKFCGTVGLNGTPPALRNARELLGISKSFNTMPEEASSQCSLDGANSTLLAAGAQLNNFSAGEEKKISGGASLHKKALLKSANLIPGQSWGSDVSEKAFTGNNNPDVPKVEMTDNLRSIAGGSNRKSTTRTVTFNDNPSMKASAAASPLPNSIIKRESDPSRFSPLALRSVSAYASLAKTLSHNPTNADLEASSDTFARKVEGFSNAVNSEVVAVGTSNSSNDRKSSEELCELHRIPQIIVESPDHNSIKGAKEYPWFMTRKSEQSRSSSVNPIGYRAGLFNSGRRVVSNGSISSDDLSVKYAPIASTMWKASNSSIPSKQVGGVATGTIPPDYASRSRRSSALETVQKPTNVPNKSGDNVLETPDRLWFLFGRPKPPTPKAAAKPATPLRPETSAQEVDDEECSFETNPYSDEDYLVPFLDGKVLNLDYEGYHTV